MSKSKLTDSEIVKALRSWLEEIRKSRQAYLEKVNVEHYPSMRYEYLLSDTIHEINRLQAENKKFKDRQKPTGASGYKIENGKVVFFTTMLGGCKIVKENLEEVVKTLNELLHEAYSKDEIVFALKCKTEELETAKADIKKLTSGKCVYLSDEETTEYCVEGPCPNYKTIAQIKAEAYKEFAERLKKALYSDSCRLVFDSDLDIFECAIDNLLKELVGEV